MYEVLIFVFYCREAETYVNNQRVFETTILSHGCVLRFGRPGHCFRFIDPSAEPGHHNPPPPVMNNVSSATLPDPRAMAAAENYVHFGKTFLRTICGNPIRRLWKLPVEVI